MQEDIIIPEDFSSEAAEVAEEANAAVTAQAEDEKLYSQKELDELIEAERVTFAEKLAEAEKLADMTESERADHRRGMLDKQLSEREAAVEKRELAIEAIERLDAAGLPRKLGICLNYTGREELDKSFSAVTAAFESALENAVHERVRFRTPKLSGTVSNDAFLAGLGGR